MDPLRRQITNAQMERLLQVIETIRVLDREMPAQVVATLLYVASHNDCHKPALEQDLNFSTASGSRNTDWLSKQHRLRKPGLDLITKEVDPTNKRRTTLKLTPKGEQLIHKITQILYGDSP
jgi:DNA-binding MarR family transcriptional regulator